FALFFLRSVAARQDYTDKVTGQRIAAVTTAQIYKGSVAFIVLQLAMVAVVMLNPQLVLGNMDKAVKVDNDTLQEMLRGMAPPSEEAGEAAPEAEESAPEAEAPSADPLQPEAQPEAAQDDPLKALQDAMKPP